MAIGEEDRREKLYDETISESMQDSIAKAVSVLQREMNWVDTDRIIVRPKVSVVKGVLPLTLYIALLVISLIQVPNISDHLEIPAWVVRSVILIVFGIVAALLYKKALIWFVRIYQRFAPEKMRASCLFEPTCSNYMILAVRKYGAIKGTIKGIGRLSRCHFPNGGIDEP